MAVGKSVGKSRTLAIRLLRGAPPDFCRGAIASGRGQTTPTHPAPDDPPAVAPEGQHRAAYPPRNSAGDGARSACFIGERQPAGVGRQAMPDLAAVMVGQCSSETEREERERFAEPGGSRCENPAEAELVGRGGNRLAAGVVADLRRSRADGRGSEPGRRRAHSNSPGGTGTESVPSQRAMTLEAAAALDRLEV